MALTTAMPCIAFAGTSRLAQGTLREIAQAVKRAIDENPQQSILVFDAVTSAPIDLNLQGSEAEVLSRLDTLEGEGDGAESAKAEAAARGKPGRPKLGVTPREITLLPRHWDWLGSQPGGASVALRKLLEQALRSTRDADRLRQQRDAAYRFIHAIAGNEPGFEAASRALFATDQAGFHATIETWPHDVRAHATHLVAPLFETVPAQAVAQSPEA
jgi:uncharacterized protein